MAAATNSAEGVRELFKTGEESDIVIKCQDREFKVHKCILICQGGFFQSAVKNAKEEGNIVALECRNDNVTILEAVLMYLYGIDYNRARDRSATFHAQVYASADFYGLAGLKHDAATHFNDLAHFHGAKGAKECFAAAKVVYTSSPNKVNELRKTLCNSVYIHLADVMGDGALSRGILSDVPGLASDLVQRHASEMRARKGFGLSGIRPVATKQPGGNESSSTSTSTLASTLGITSLGASSGGFFSSLPRTAPGGNIFANVRASGPTPRATAPIFTPSGVTNEH